nr:hypothetical protein [Chlamydiota bacterium]
VWASDMEIKGKYWMDLSSDPIPFDSLELIDTETQSGTAFSPCEVIRFEK